MNNRLIPEVWTRLSSGRSLEGLDLGRVDRRIDLRELVVPRRDPDEIVEIRGVHWKGLDLAKSQLESLRFHDCVIENCSFDNARCRDWRLWGSSVVETSFRGSDLREAALGGVAGERRNAFRRVDFSRADLRRTAYVSADFTDCLFAAAKLVKVDFGGSVFVDCTFVGKLEEVEFYRHAFRGEHFPPNEMRGVDFRHATLRFVEFRGLDMASVKWPEGDDHVVIENYVVTLDRAIAKLQGRDDLPSRRLSALLAVMRKWAGPNQRVGVVSKLDLIEAAGETAVAEVKKLMG